MGDRTEITIGLKDRLEALALLAETRLERIEKQQAEIERLRLEHGRCLAELGRWPSIKGELSAEIDGLRRLLQEALGHIEPDTGWDYDGKGGYLYDRVRKALGE